MCQIRAMVESICRLHVAGWLLVMVLAASGTGAFAQAPVEAGKPGRAAAGEVRGAVTSGLGEWGLQQRFPDSAIWLDLQSGDRTLALFWPEMETPAKGAVIILADEGGNGESGLAGALARELAQRKLSVLSLGLEPPPAGLELILERPLAPPGEDPGDEGGDVSGTATIDVMEVDAPGDLEAAYRARIDDELAAGVAELGKREYQVIALIGIGRGSNHVVQHAAELNAPPALVWVQPKFYGRDQGQLAGTLAQTAVPRILELSAANDSEQRRARLSRAGVKGFSLQSVGAGTGFLPRDSKALASRISAWLTPQTRP